MKSLGNLYKENQVIYNNKKLFVLNCANESDAIFEEKEEKVELVIIENEKKKEEQAEKLEKVGKIIKEKLVDADLEAKKILEDAILKAKDIKEKAYKEGYKDGLEKHEKEAEILNKKALEKAENIYIEAVQKRDQMFNGFEEEIRDLAIGIAEKIICYEIDTDKKYISSVIKDSIDKCKSLNMKVNMNSENAKVLSLNNDLCLNGVQIYEDNKLRKDEFIIETDNGYIDISFMTQLLKIKTGLRRLAK